MTNTRTPDHPVDPMFPARWSPRAFGAQPVETAQMLTLLEAARWAPSASNVQPWRFAWGLRGDAGFQAILAALNPGNRAWAGQAGALLAVASVPTRTASDGGQVANATHGFDSGAAWVSLAFQAHLSGLVTHAMGGFDHAALRAGLSAPEGLAFHAVVAVGHPGDPADLTEALRAREVASGRKPLDQIALRGGFPG